MTNKIILGFTGLMACGKGTAAKYLVEKHRAISFRFSTTMRDLLDRLYLEHSRENMSKISLVIREGFGQDVFSRVMAKDVINSEAAIVVIDGIRRMEDLDHLKNIPGFKLVAVDVDMRTRYERLIARRENSDDQIKTWEQFQADHQLETEVTISETVKAADITIDNNGTSDDLNKQLDELVK